MSEPQVTKDLAQHFLRDIEPRWKAFWFHMHLMAKNLTEFAVGMGDLTEEVYRYHCSGQKNDFVSWIQEVVGDSELARRLHSVDGKEEAARVVQARVKELQAALNGQD
jgi:hypothetical protein